MNVLVFDIETIPDVVTIRKLHKLEDKLTDQEVVDWINAKTQEERGTTFLPIHLHKVACISAVMARGTSIKVWTIGEEESSESDIIQRFYAGIEKYTPTIISWNGTGFDLPVLHYRAMHHKISAPRYWETGDNDQGFKWNNYISRYHARHLDLLDVLALFNTRAFVKLDEAAVLMGFPGKMGQSGASVWDQYAAGGLKDIRDYCETDVLNTYLMYLRFELMRGHFMPNEYDAHCDRLKQYLADEDKSHLTQFLEAWGANSITSS